MTRRLRRWWWGCRPEGGSTFFRRERKYQRKHAARRLQRRPAPLCVAGFGLREPNGWTPRIYSGRPIPAVRPEQSDHVPWADCPQGLSSTSVRCAHPPGKRLLLPILMAGLAMSRAMKLDSFHKLLERARARLFPPSKWAGLFPSAAYRRSRPRGQRGAYLSLVAWDVAVWLEYICNTKCQRGFKSTLAFLSSHKACRRMAVYISQLTGNRTRPASREACRRAAVIQRPSRMSHWHPARPWRAVRG